MSNIAERVFRDVCLDERIKDGIFNLEEQEHMDALRDYFIKKGITREAAIHVTNRMVEGKYPERQAWRRDGILVTFPTPQHKAKAMAKDPGKYTDKDPKPKTPEQPEEPDIEEPMPDEEDPEAVSRGKSLPKSDEEEPSKKEPTIFQGDKELKVEPPRGDEKPEPSPQPISPVFQPTPRTPQRVAAEKEIARQIMNTDDTVLSNVAGPINEKALNHQLNELYKKADEWGFKEAITFLTPYVKP